MEPEKNQGVCIISASRILGGLGEILRQEEQTHNLGGVINTIRQENKNVSIPSYESFPREKWDVFFSAVYDKHSGTMQGNHGCRNGNNNAGENTSTASSAGSDAFQSALESMRRILSPPAAFFDGHTARELPSILEAIGCTPVVRLSRAASALGLFCQLLGKCEFLSAGGSMKDRIARGMVLAAEAQGRLAPRAALIEPTSGNTGIGLAMVAAVRGYRSVAVMPMKMSAEKHRIMKALGSTILRTPTAAAWDDQNSHIALSLRLQEAMLAEQQREGSTGASSEDQAGGAASMMNGKHGETSNGNSSTGSSSNSNSSSNESSSSSTDRYHEQIACILDQYRNPANPLSHFFGTGTELLAQCSNKLDMVVICAGTGGSLTGVGRRIKAALPQCIVVGVDPEGSVLADPSCSTVKPYAVEGIGYDFVPTVLDRAAADCWVKTTDEESLLCSRLLLRTEGMLVGGSAGAALAGAIKAIEHYGWTQDPTKRIAFLLPDSSRNYTTKFISDEWMVAKGFLDAGILDRQYNDLGVLGLQSVPLPALSFVSAAASLKETAAVLLQSAQPFVVVVKPEAAAAAAERGGVDAGDIVGTVTDQTLLKAMGDFPSTAEVKEVVDTEIPIFRCIDTSLARVAQTLELYPFVLIQSNTGLVTSAVEAKKLLQAFIDQQPQTQT